MKTLLFPLSALFNLLFRVKNIMWFSGKHSESYRYNGSYIQMRNGLRFLFHLADLLESCGAIAETAINLSPQP